MKIRVEVHTAFLIFVFALLELTTVAQQTGGVITGRVITEDGLPIPHALVSILGVSGRVNQPTINRESVTDDDGKFVVDGLNAIPYLVSARAPGYVPASDGVLNPFELSAPHFVKLGEMVTLKLMRGGVITGRVTNDVGEPVIGVPVKATPVSDETGRSTSVDIGYAQLWTRTTDDRGVYRIHGLAPGSYIVAAGGPDASSDRATPFAGRTTTYHPSSTRDAATVVNVSSGLEATDIDIRYHGETGFSISGKINGMYSKPIVFRPEAKVRWNRGKHALESTAGLRISPKPLLKLLHYRYLGYEYTKARNARNYERCGADKGPAWSCAPDYDGVDKEHSPAWAEFAKTKAFDVIKEKL